MTAAHPSPAPPEDVPTILVVDDSDVDRRLAGRLLETQGGWRVTFAADGEAALAVMAADLPRVVLTDLRMPGVDGLALVEQVRKRFPRVPVVLMTSQGSEEVAAAAIRAGAAGYVPKRCLADDLVPAVGQVLSATRAVAGRDRVLACLTRTDRRFELASDPALVGPLVAVLRDDLLAAGVCDEHGAMRCGVALEEALLNAVYHGNLGVSSALKEESDAAFYRQVAERRGQTPYRDRRVRVSARFTPARAVFVIADEGAGFDLSSLPAADDPEALTRPSGRGLVMMRLLMDEVTYSPPGNRVTLVKRRSVGH